MSDVISSEAMDAITLKLAPLAVQKKEDVVEEDTDSLAVTDGHSSGDDSLGHEEFGGEEIDDDDDDDDDDEEEQWSHNVLNNNRFSTTATPTSTLLALSNVDPAADIQFVPSAPQYGLTVVEKDDVRSFAACFLNCTFQGTFFYNCILINVTFEDCEFDGMRFVNVVLRNRHYKGCRFKDAKCLNWAPPYDEDRVVDLKDKFFGTRPWHSPGEGDYFGRKVPEEIVSKSHLTEVALHEQGYRNAMNV